MAPWTLPIEQIADESISTDWRTGVLNLANRRHRPQRLGSWKVCDRRLDYVLWFLDVRDAVVLELGPLEGYFSVLLDKLGIARSVAIEARAGNLAKCLHVKQLFGLDRTDFVQHDIEALVRGEEAPSFAGPFDLVFGLGVLYHLRDPVAALRWTADQARALFLGTHYVERRDERWYSEHLFEECELRSVGRRYTGKRYADDPVSSLGGLYGESMWLDEESLVRALGDAGYDSIAVLGRDVQAEFPHITLLAERTRP